VRRKIRKAKVSRKSRKPQRGESGNHQAIETTARDLGLKIDPSWLTSVRAHWQVVLKHARTVNEFEIPEETEPAPVFKP